jgi:hypothetical protein
MSAGDQNALTREQVLDELEFLAQVEHALVVECLSVCYAFGHDLGADEGGPTTKQGGDAAGAAFSLARNTEMFHLGDLNIALIHANRPPQLDRAASIPSGPGPDISLGPPDLAQLQQLVAREQAIATAVDARYARLAPAVTRPAAGVHVPLAHRFPAPPAVTPAPPGHAAAAGPVTECHNTPPIRGKRTRNHGRRDSCDI